jgi:hypothetical protein
MPSTYFIALALAAWTAVISFFLVAGLMAVVELEAGACEPGVLGAGEGRLAGDVMMLATSGPRGFELQTGPLLCCVVGRVWREAQI